MVNWDYIKNNSVKIDEIAVSPEGSEYDIILLKGKESSPENVPDLYGHMHDVPRSISEQILSLTKRGNLDTNFIRDVMEYTGRYVETVYQEEHFHKGKPTEFGRAILKFSTGEEMNPVSPDASLVFGLASKADIYSSKRKCHEKNMHRREIRRILDSADFISLKDLPSEREKTEIHFNPNGYEELKSVGASKLCFEKSVRGKRKRIIGNVLSVSYSKNGNRFLFPLPFPHDQLVLERYADRAKDSPYGKSIRKALEGCRQKEHMEVLGHILNDIKRDSVFINGKIIEMSSNSNTFLVKPIDTFIRLEMDGLRTFKTSYFFGLNSAFLDLDKIMLKPQRN